MRRTTIIAATTLAIALAACGGSSSSKGGSGGSERSTTSSAVASGGGEFGDLAAKAKDADVRVTYRSGGRDGDFTIAQFGGDSYIAFGNDAFYSVGGKSVTCQGTGADAQCFELPGNADIGGTIVQSFFGSYAAIFDGVRNESNAFGSVKVSSNSETIAGRAATCASYAASAAGQSGSVTLCLDRETGYVLRVGSSANGDSASQIEATSFRTSTAADVTPPATPQGIPGT